MNNANDFEPMTRKAAESIAGWNYDYPYSFYNHKSQPNGVEELVSSLRAPSNHYYFAVDKLGEPIAFLCFGDEAKVNGGNYRCDAIDIGGGLRPNMTGVGLGQTLMVSGLILAARLFPASTYRTTIAAFNERAQRTAKKAGFLEQDRFVRPGDGVEFVVLLLEQLQALAN